MRSISIMRINLLLFCILLSAFTSSLYAQQYEKNIVKISQTPIDITSLAKTIAKQTGLQYSLNMQNSSLKKRITLKTGNWLLSDILKQVQQQAGLNHRILGDHILFMDYLPPVNKSTITNTATPLPLPSTVGPHTLKAGNNKAPDAMTPSISTARQLKSIAGATVKSATKNTVAEKITVSKIPSTVKTETGTNAKANQITDNYDTSVTNNTTNPAIKQDSTYFLLPGRSVTGSMVIDTTESLLPLSPAYTVSGYTQKMFSLTLFDNTDNTGNKTMPVIRNTVQPLMKKIAITKEKRQKESNGRQRNKSFRPSKLSPDDVEWYQPVVKTGLSTDEILYLNASLMAGIKYVYGIISYGYAFPGGRFRWGAGVPIRLNETQELHFSFTTGTLKRGTSPDSSIVYGVKERLTRYGAGWSTTVSSRITFQAQLHYNILKKTSDSTSIYAQTAAGDSKHFSYGKVPYTLSESYGAYSYGQNYSTAGDFKRWIGIQLSLFYKLF
ncbi:hypothetical protein SAMN04488121_101776 [Chitinophaga filiformis]|uniref:Secretin/TonB short N-terminal domain-containing protein n=1 Tax=Chitinophaga filiformis TaxID=104663 RepID=A0A1G7IAA2_CHIFI|nr:hypothetical protein SAMN04488121_101776 [Chitinophaga filiformis]